MIKHTVKRLIALASRPVSYRTKVRLVNFTLSSFSESDKLRFGLPTVEGLLQTMKANGFFPKTIIDIGANVGGWSKTVASVFSSAQFFLIDANPNNYLPLKAVAPRIGSKSEFSIALLGPQERSDVRFYDLGTGSSVLPELTSHERSEITLPMLTLDQLLAARNCDIPILLKLDVQGYELEVLRGGQSILARAEVVIMETSLVPYNSGAPLIAEVISYMSDKGFVPFDFCGQARRESDHLLYQTDLAFVKTTSKLRAPRKFWLQER